MGLYDSIIGFCDGLIAPFISVVAFFLNKIVAIIQNIMPSPMGSWFSIWGIYLLIVVINTLIELFAHRDKLLGHFIGNLVGFSLSLPFLSAISQEVFWEQIWGMIFTLMVFGVFAFYKLSKSEENYGWY